MSRFHGARILALLLPFLAVTAQAGLDPLTITVTRVKKDESEDREGSAITVTTKEIAYRVNLENRSFQPLANLEVKYQIFYEDIKTGSANDPVVVAHTGIHKIAALGSNREIEFETAPLALTRSELDPGWVWASGASGRQKDRVVGVWIRAFVDGKQVGEYVNPTTLGKKQTWKE